VTGVSVLEDPAEKARGLLKAQSWIREVAEDPAGGLRVACEPSRFAEVNALLVAAGVAVKELTPARQTLEEFFLAQ